uniref:Hyaluronidase n=2 Tax=Rhodnius prolixus TaxID=13249 RepID=T1IDR5_RHOPR
MLFSITTSRLINEKGNKYSIYWNVPTFQCHKYGYNFTNLTDYGIIQNTADKFQGDRIAIMYDPGYYPAIIDGKFRNGGVPQEGNLSKHLVLFKKDLEKAVPDPNFKGIGIIDFERWRPIYRENWASLDIYRQVSKEIEAKKHPELSKSAIEKKAARRFEKYAFSFFNDTLALAIELRPKAKWGYYAFPYCFNFTPKNAQKECTNVVKEDNNRSTWMYKTGTSIFPSVYLPQNKLSEKKKAQLIEYRILESIRITEMSGTKLSVLPYVHYKYTDTHAFLSK